MSTLRERIVKAFTVEPDTFRVLNAGALEEQLWTEDEWRDEYADDLAAELTSMESEGLLIVGEVWGMTTYSLAPVQANADSSTAETGTGGPSKPKGALS